MRTLVSVRAVSVHVLTTGSREQASATTQGTVMHQERMFCKAPRTHSCPSIHSLELSWMNRLGLARVFQSVPVSLPQPEVALQVFQLVSCEQVLLIKVVWNVHPGAWTYNSQWIPLAIAAHTGGTQRSLCLRTFPVPGNLRAFHWLFLPQAASSHPGLHLTSMTSSVMENGWQLHQPIPSGPWDTSHQVPQT